MNVGMDWTSYLVASSDSSSTLSLPNSILSLYFAASLSTIGSMVLQGPHHTAQKSTKTGLSPLILLSKSDVLSRTIGSDLWEAWAASLFAFSFRILVSSGSDNVSLVGSKVYFNILAD